MLKLASDHCGRGGAERIRVQDSLKFRSDLQHPAGLVSQRQEAPYGVASPRRTSTPSAAKVEAKPQSFSPPFQAPPRQVEQPFHGQVRGVSHRPRREAGVVIEVIRDHQVEVSHR